MRHLLAILFIALFSFQVVPVKEIGKLLCSGQLTEELPHTCNDACKSSFNDEVWKKLWHYERALHQEMIVPSAIACPSFDADESLIQYLQPDVALQPPNSLPLT